MSSILLLSLIAAAGVLLAGVAVALPPAIRRAETYGWDAGAGNRSQPASLRDRINQPFQAFAERSGRQRRLNGGLTLAEHLARADIKLRISDELTRALREMSLGSSTPQALVNMVRRVGSEDFDLIVTAITIQASVGGNLARILDGISHTIRQRVQMKAQISALTAQMRASGWIITLLPFIVAGILNIITPSYFGVMFTDPAGRVLLVLAGISIFIGNMLVR